MMTRARVEKANQVSVRRWAGMRLSSTLDLTGAKRPSESATASRVASTVMNTSAGLLAPSLRIRSISSSSLPSMRLILMPVCLVMAGGIEVEDFLLRQRRQGSGESEQGDGKAGFHCGLRWQGIGCGEPE